LATGNKKEWSKHKNLLGLEKPSEPHSRLCEADEFVGVFWWALARAGKKRATHTHTGPELRS